MSRGSSSQAARRLRRRARRVRQAVEAFGLVTATTTVVSAVTDDSQGGNTMPNTTTAAAAHAESAAHTAATAATTPTPTPTGGVDTTHLGGIVGFFEHASHLEDVGVGLAGVVAVAGVAVANGWYKSWIEQSKSGYATKSVLKRNLSAKAVLKDVSQVMPRLAELPKDERKKLPTYEYALHLGNSIVPRVPVYCGYKEVGFIVGPAQQGKSSLLATFMLQAPGAIVSTCTKLDLFESTFEYRSRLGNVWLMNPELQAGRASNFRWSPVSGCENPVVALERAAAMINAAGSNGDVTDSGFWTDMGTQLLACLLHAAGIGGRDIMEVWTWANDPMSREPGKILERNDRSGKNWANQLGAIQTLEPRQQSSIYSTMRRALSFLLNPALAEMAMPDEDHPGIDIESFVLSRDSIYLVGEDTPGTSLASYFTAFVTAVHTTAKRVATQRPGRRLDPGILFALDELALICPVPLDRWAADSGGRGIAVWGCCQAISQLDTKFGREQARTIWAASNVHIILGGVKDHEYIEGLSRMLGEREVDVIGESSQGSWGGGGPRTISTSKHPQMRRAIPPQEIVQLQRWTALCLYRNLPPIKISYRPIWQHPEIIRAKKAAKKAAKQRQTVMESQ